LNGQQLLEWLKKEDGAKNLRAHTRRFGAEEEGQATNFDFDDVNGAQKPEEVEREPELPFPELETSQSNKTSSHAHNVPKARAVELEQLGHIQNLVISLGFEERCLPSAARLAKQVRPRNILAIEYGIPGKIAETQQLAEEMGANFERVKIDDLMSGANSTVPGKTLIDASGLTKPAIFKLVKDYFAKQSVVWTAITEPEEYQPTESDLSAAIGDGVEF